MAFLQFPKNDEALDRGVSRVGTGAGRRGFSRPWLQFFQAMYDRMKAVETDTAQISTADLGAAGASYSQAAAQAQNDLINELKAQVNALQASLNK